MARPPKTRSLAGPPRPVMYIPAGWTREQTPPAEVAIEDFEVMRLVDGHALKIEEAADKIGVSRSTAGRMLERARRGLALAFERHEPVYIDSAEGCSLVPPVEGVIAPLPRTGGGAVQAVAVDGCDPASPVAEIFGRARRFALAGCSGKLRFVDNPGANARRNAAKRAADALRSLGVGRVIAGRFGPDALGYLGEAGIEAMVASGISVERAVVLFRPAGKRGRAGV